MKDYDLEHPDITRALETGYPYDTETEYPICPNCGSEAETFMLNTITGEILGCDECIKGRDAWELVEKMRFEV